MNAYFNNPILKVSVIQCRGIKDSYDGLAVQNNAVCVGITVRPQYKVVTKKLYKELLNEVL